MKQQGSALQCLYWGCSWKRKKGDDAKKDQMPERLEIKPVLSERGRMAGHRFMGGGTKPHSEPTRKLQARGVGHLSSKYIHLNFLAG